MKSRYEENRVIASIPDASATLCPCKEKRTITGGAQLDCSELTAFVTAMFDSSVLWIRVVTKSGDICESANDFLFAFTQVPVSLIQDCQKCVTCLTTLPEAFANEETVTQHTVKKRFEDGIPARIFGRYGCAAYHLPQKSGALQFLVNLFHRPLVIALSNSSAAKTKANVNNEKCDSWIGHNRSCASSNEIAQNMKELGTVHAFNHRLMFGENKHMTQHLFIVLRDDTELNIARISGEFDQAIRDVFDTKIQLVQSNALKTCVGSILSDDSEIGVNASQSLLFFGSQLSTAIELGTDRFGEILDISLEKCWPLQDIRFRLLLHHFLRLLVL